MGTRHSDEIDFTLPNVYSVCVLERVFGPPLMVGTSTTVDARSSFRTRLSLSGSAVDKNWNKSASQGQVLGLSCVIFSAKVFKTIRVAPPPAPQLLNSVRFAVRHSPASSPRPGFDLVPKPSLIEEQNRGLAAKNRSAKSKSCV